MKPTLKGGRLISAPLGGFSFSAPVRRNLINVRQVIELTKEWVEVHGSQVPGFCGAHLMGGLNYTPKDAPFPIYKDVDLNILLQEGQGWEVCNLSYKGLILEYGSVSVEAYRSSEVVLTDNRLASNLAVNSILSDPQGILSALHNTIAKEYPRRRWVLARCANAKNSALKSLEELRRAGSPVEAFFHLSFFMLDLAGLVAIANLTPPTHRRCLILMKEVLEPWEHADLQEKTLNVYGCAHWSRTQVESYLQDCATAFDRAVEVTQTPITYGFKLRPFVRPYVVEGAREMINEGSHREAVLWIAAFLYISNTAIQVDASDEEKPHFQTKVDQFVSDMGLSTTQDVESRFQQAKILAEKIFKVADDIANRNPRIVD